MKYVRYLFILCLILLLLSYPIGASDELLDDAGDVYHHVLIDDIWMWELVTDNKDNIDITKVTYGIRAGSLTVEFEVNGPIQDSNTIKYLLFYNTSDASYVFTYMERFRT